MVALKVDVAAFEQGNLSVIAVSVSHPDSGLPVQGLKKNNFRIRGFHGFDGTTMNATIQQFDDSAQDQGLYRLKSKRDLPAGQPAAWFVQVNHVIKFKTRI